MLNPETADALSQFTRTSQVAAILEKSGSKSLLTEKLKDERYENFVAAITEDLIVAPPVHRRNMLNTVRSTCMEQGFKDDFQVDLISEVLIRVLNVAT